MERTVTAVPFLFACFCLCMLETKCPTNQGNCEFPRWIEMLPHVCQVHLPFWKVSHKSHRVHVLIGWQLLTHVYQSFPRQIQVYQHEKVGEKDGENRGKFYLSPTVCQCVCRLFLCRPHTPTWVCPHEFANFSLPSEGCLRPLNVALSQPYDSLLSWLVKQWKFWELN